MTISPDQNVSANVEVVSHNDTITGSVTELVHISHYEPWAGGTNCARFVNGECVSKMASGKRWQDYVDVAAACPVEWEFGTEFETPDGRRWICLDRGGAIRYGYTPYWMEPDGLAWVDLLTSQPGYKFGEVVEVKWKK